MAYWAGEGFGKFQRLGRWIPPRRFDTEPSLAGDEEVTGKTRIARHDAQTPLEHILSGFSALCLTAAGSDAAGAASARSSGRASGAGACWASATGAAVSDVSADLSAIVRT